MHTFNLIYTDMLVSIVVLGYVYMLFYSLYLARRLCTVTVNMCACEPETCTLLRYGLRPATATSPRQTAFSIPLLELSVSLSLECQVSVEGFSQHPISHFRHHHFRQRSLVDICPQLNDGTICPACPKVGYNSSVVLV